MVTTEETERARAHAALLLIGRLVKRHDLTVEEAVTAVVQRRRRETGPHTHLVAAEATAIMREAVAPIRAAMEAFKPAVEAARAMAELVRAFQQSAQHTAADGTSAGRDRPAWASPYGPPPRRHRS